MAYAGVAATLIDGGCTIHNSFKFPINLQEWQIKNLKIPKRTKERLQRAKIIIVDEVSMCNKIYLEAMDEILRTKVMNVNIPFGGKNIVVVGDFRQIPPIIRKGRNRSIIDASFKMSRVFKRFDIMRLKKNEKVSMKYPHDIRYAKFLLDLGNGDFPTIDEYNKTIEIPAEVESDFKNLSDFIEKVFVDMKNAS